ncbi:MAG: hypothetical protein JXN64_12430 [Spirochaetes bacterium]|nr:hypothetical protein [Spirochaetota bacterium]
MIKNIFKFIIIISLLFGLPLIGIILSGKSIKQYASFPPASYCATQAAHAQFSWTAFIIISLIIMIFILPVIFFAFKYLKQHRNKIYKSAKFSWWGKSGIILMIFFWVLAWGRFSIFAVFQEYNFFLLWVSFTIAVNSLQFKRTGKCLLTGQPVLFLLLFPASAVFWWYFEYINGFVLNWSYISSDYSNLKIFLLSTLAFSTVLPAVSSMSSLLLSYAWINKGFNSILRINITMPKLTALPVFIIFCAGLALIGVFPDYLFPLVWVSPLFIILCLQVFFNERHIFSGISDGNWSLIVSASIAALICGFFWEMWNLYSIPKWQYSVPLVHRFLIFEMPVLGYSGYIPFGMLCVSISKMIGLRHD